MTPTARCATAPAVLAHRAPSAHSSSAHSPSAHAPAALHACAPRAHRFAIAFAANGHSPPHPPPARLPLRVHAQYVRHWVPELANVRGSKVHEPWSLSIDEQRRYGVMIGVDYPNPPKSAWRGFPDSGGRGGKGGGKGGGGGGRGGTDVVRTPSQGVALGAGKGRGRAGGRGGGRKRVQHAGFE